MKQLLLIRHAKSSWSNVNVQDFERTLNDRGLKDAPRMAKRLHEKIGKADAIVSSTATRALETANFFADEFDVKKKHIVKRDDLYLPAPEAFAKVIAEFDDDWKTVLVFSHNPAITLFANQLTPIKVDDMPTCAIFAVKADIKQWADFMATEKQFWFFDYPKNPFP